MACGDLTVDDTRESPAFDHDPEAGFVYDAKLADTTPAAIEVPEVEGVEPLVGPLAVGFVVVVLDVAPRSVGLTDV